MRRLGDDEYDMEETPNGAYVEYSDYKELEEAHRSLVKRYAALTRVDKEKTLALNTVFNPHD